MLALIFAAAVSGSPLPTIDVDANCLAYGTKNQGMAGSYAAKRYREECVKSEQRQYDYLAEVWETLTEPQKIECLRRKPATQYPIYTELGYCALGFATTNEQRRERETPVMKFRR